MINRDTDNHFYTYEDIPLFLNATDLIKLLGLSRTTVYYMLRANDFPTIVIGNRRMVRKEKLFQWLEEHENARKEGTDQDRHPQQH